MPTHNVEKSYPPVDFTKADAKKDDVKYRLYTKLEEQGCLITDDFLETNTINRQLPTKFLIHGWTTNERSVWYKPLKNEYLRKGPHNVFYVDWSQAGNKTYQVSAANAKPIGTFIGEFIVKCKLNLDKVHVIGHSLGSHVAGFVGKSVYNLTGMKIGRITGTDPAWPLFENEKLGPDGRLDKTDANFVDIIHTDIGHFGYTKALGHADFYPNGGTLQPGCPSLEIDDNCSHAKSNVYFIKSVNSKDLLARNCSSWNDYLNGNFLTTESVIFGENTDHSSRGSFFLNITANIEDYL